MLRKIGVSLLTLLMVISCIPISNVHALEINPEELRVSDEYVAKYPNGLIEFANVETEINEDAKETTIYVVRRGGSEGEVSVNLKAIEVSAKYGDDFVIMDEGIFGPKEVKKNIESKTLLEGSIEDNKDEAITADGYEENSEEEKKEQEVPEEKKEDKKEEKQADKKEAEEVKAIQVDKKYESSLHVLKDKTLNQESTYKPSKVNSENIFDIQDEESRDVNEALNTVLPGAKLTLTFGEGEVYKEIKIRVKDDNIYEDDEAFSLGLYELSKGELGDHVSSNFVIHDNDPMNDVTSYSFKDTSVAVSPSNDKVRLQLNKTSNTSSLSTFTVKTRGGSAKADENYASIVKEGVFLAGQTTQYIDVPILNKEVEESLFFEVVVFDDKEVASAKVEILPRDYVANKAKAKATSEPRIHLDATKFTNSTREGSAGTWNNGKYYYLHLDGWEHYRAAQLDTKADLRAASKVLIDMEVKNCSSGYKERNREKIFVGTGTDKSPKVSLTHNQSRKVYTIPVTTDIRKNTNITVQAQSWWHNNATVDVFSIDIVPSKITIVEATTKSDKIDIYNGNKDVGDYKKNVLPGKISATNLNSSRTNAFYAGDTIRIKPSLTNDALNSGFYMSGIEVKNKNGKFDTITNKLSANGAYYDLKLTNDFVSKYASFHSDGNCDITLKPIFSRKKANTTINVADYQEYQGTLKISDTKLAGGSKYKTQSNWKQGDYVVVTATPKEHYRTKGIMVDGTLIKDTYGNQANQYLVPLNAENVKVEPVFERTNCKVNIIDAGKYVMGEDGKMTTQPVDEAEMYLVHDKPKNMSPNEKKWLYRKTDGLSNYDEKGNLTNKLTNKLKANYEMYYDLIREGRTLNNLAIGDIVTLSAEPMNDDYIPIWQVSNGSDSTSSSDTIKYLTHYGNSYSFEVESVDTTIKCALAKKSEQGLVDESGKSLAYILDGTVVTMNKDLKHGGAFDRIDYNNPATFRALPNVQLSTMSFDVSKSTYTENGTTYNSGVVSDKNGKFKMYIPNVPKTTTDFSEKLFSIKYYYGDVEKAVSAASFNRHFYLEVPYRDQDYLVSAINLYKGNKLDEVGGVITIPANANEGNRTFKVNTMTTEGHKISKVNLNIYNGNGVKTSTLTMKYESGDKRSQIWSYDCNIKELLASGHVVKVEAFDETEHSRGEVESGYTFNEAPGPFQVTTKDVGGSYSENGSADIPVTGTSVPNVPSEKVAAQPNDDLEIAVGAGETIKNAIKDNIEVYESKTAIDKLVFLTNYLTESFNVNVSKKEKQSKDKSATGKFPILFDFGMYVKFSKSEDDKGVTRMYLNHAMVTMALKASADVNLQYVLFGIPLYVSLGASGYGRGVTLVEGAGQEFNKDCIKDDKLMFVLNNYSDYNPVVTKEVESDEKVQKLFKTLANIVYPDPTTLPSANESLAMFSTNTDNPVLNVINANALAKFRDEAVRVIGGATKLSTLYADHKDVFDAFSANFNQQLVDKIKTYEDNRLFNESNDCTGSSLSDSWIKKFNLELMVACLPQYLEIPRTYVQYGDNGMADLNLNVVDRTAAAGIVTLQPRFSIGAGVGKRGTLSVGVSGHTDFILNYQLWDEGRGTVTFAFNADIDVLIIPLSFRIASYTLEMFKSKGYVESAFDHEALGPGGIIKKAAQNASMSASVGQPGRLSSQPKFKQRNLKNKRSLGDDDIVTEEYESTIETTKHPEPKLFELKNGNKLVIFFNDNVSRGTYDKNSIYYSISSKKSGTNMDVWSKPKELEADGTIDGDMNALQLPDGRVVLAWSDSSKQFGNDLPDMADYLSSQNISYVEFNENGKPGDIQTVTNNDKYSYGLPRLSYDNDRKEVMLTYKVVDYHTEGIKFDYDKIEDTYANFFNNSFSTLAYSINKNGKWVNSNKEGLTTEHFIDVDIPDLENPNIEELAIGYYNNNTVISYIVDSDKNTGTIDDREMFVVLYSHQDKTFSKPIRCTKDMVEDLNVHVVVNDYINSIYYGSGNKVLGLSLDAFFKDGKLSYDNFTSVENGAYYEMKFDDPTIYSVDDNIIDYESHDAASSFDLTMGANGQLYMYWNELSSQNMEVDEVDETDEKKKAHEQRNIYMQVYDTKLQKNEDIENGKSGLGGWGSTSRITEDLDTYQNEISLLVDENHNFTLAWRQFDVKDEANSSVESETSTMYITEFEVVSSVEIDESSVSGNEEYSRAGETVSVGFDVANYGFIPTESVQFNYYLSTDKEVSGFDSVDELNELYFEHWGHPMKGKSAQMIESSAVESYFNSKAKIHQDINFTMPEFDNEVTLYVVAWEGLDEIGDIVEPSILEIPIKVEANFTVLNQTSSISSEQDEIKIVGTIINDGNKDASNVKFNLVNKETKGVDEMFDDKGNMIEPKEEDIITLDAGTLKVGEKYDFDILISDDDKSKATIKKKKVRKMLDSDGNVEFDLTGTYGKDTRATIKKKKDIKTISVQSSNEDKQTLSGLTTAVKSDAKARSANSDETLRLRNDQTKNLNISLEPYSASKYYSIDYVTSDANVATVSTDGYVTGHNNGTAQVIIRVRQINPENIIALSERGIEDVDGNKIEVDKDGNVLGFTGSENPVTYEKVINVVVDANGGVEELPEDKPPVVEQPNIKPDKSTNADTSDNYNILIWFTLAITAYVGYRVVRKRKEDEVV